MNRVNAVAPGPWIQHSSRKSARTIRSNSGGCSSNVKFPALVNYSTLTKLEDSIEETSTSRERCKVYFVPCQ